MKFLRVGEGEVAKPNHQVINESRWVDGEWTIVSLKTMFKCVYWKKVVLISIAVDGSSNFS